MVVGKKAKTRSKPKKLTKKEKELRIYGVRGYVAGKNRKKAEIIVEEASEKEDRLILLHPGKETTLATARRVVLRDRKPLRITPKRPKLRR